MIDIKAQEDHTWHNSQRLLTYISVRQRLGRHGLVQRTLVESLPPYRQAVCRADAGSLRYFLLRSGSGHGGPCGS